MLGARVEAAECVTAKNCQSKYTTKYTHMCLRACIGSKSDPLECTPILDLNSERVSAHGRSCQTGHIGRAGGGCSHAILRAGLGTDTTQAGDQRGPCLERQPGSWCVCQCLWNMPLCLPVNLGLVPLHLHPECPVTAEGNGHVASFSLFSKTKPLV